MKKYMPVGIKGQMEEIFQHHPKLLSIFISSVCLLNNVDVCIVYLYVYVSQTCKHVYVHRKKTQRDTHKYRET